MSGVLRHPTEMTYLGSHLVHNMTAGEISDLVRIADSDIEGRVRSFLHANTGFGLPFRPFCVTRGLYRRRPSEPCTILFQIHGIRQASSCGRLGGR